MKTRYSLLLASIYALGATAQTQYDAYRFSEHELNGTARFVGMGGAMGALGADISVIGTNPAGIGLFRGHDVSTSFSFNSTHVKSDFLGVEMKEKKNMMSYDQLGFVYSTKIGNKTNLRYINFGFNYHKSNNLNKIFSSGGILDGLSQTNQMANMMNGVKISDIDDIYNYGTEEGKDLQNPYHPVNSNYPYLGVMGVRTGLVALNDKGKTIGWNGEKNYYNSREEGGIQQYDFNVSFNVQDKMYFGLTLGVYDVDYRRTSLYSENIYDGKHVGYYEMTNMFNTSGTGFDLKLGAIFRPVEDSPFRFGLAIHTPTWYSLTDIYDTNIYAEINYNKPDKETECFKANEKVSDYVDGETMHDYKLTTPWKFNVNAGTVLGGVMAIGAEYEFSTYNYCKLHYNDGYEMVEQNEIIKNDLKGVHTLRVGVETRISPAFSLRAGYNFSTQAFKKSSYKALNSNDMRTDVEYNNKMSQNIATVGLGYRGRIFYADLAYKYNVYKSDFYPFSDNGLAPSKLTNERHQALMTVGVHF